MYQEARRRRIYTMQSMSRQQATDGLNTQTRTITIITILLFAISGLLSGFAFGAFIRPKQATVTTPHPGTTVVVQKGQSPTAVPTMGPQKIGYPTVPQWTVSEKADSTTTYTFSSQAVDQSIDAGRGKPLHAPGITCKIWLIKELAANARLDVPTDRLQDTANLAKPITASAQGQKYEEITGLNFTTTQQTQKSDANGQCKWQYQVTTAIAPGEYDMVILNDWNAEHWNWYWRAITITKADA